MKISQIEHNGAFGKIVRNVPKMVKSDFHYSHFNLNRVALSSSGNSAETVGIKTVMVVEDDVTSVLKLHEDTTRSRGALAPGVSLTHASMSALFPKTA